MRPRLVAPLAGAGAARSAALAACSGDDSVGEVPADGARHGIRQWHGIREQ